MAVSHGCQIAPQAVRLDGFSQQQNNLGGAQAPR
jgi:hypothetical protein